MSFCNSSYGNGDVYREHTMRLRAINPHAASQHVFENAAASGKETMAEALHAAELNSEVRKWRPPPGVSDHFSWSINAIPKEKEATMRESVDLFLSRMTYDSSAGAFDIKEMTESMTPYEVSSARLSFRPGPRRLVRAFDRSGVYDSKQKPLVTTLPNLQIVRDFKKFVTQRNQKMSKILENAPVAVSPRVDNAELSHRARQSLFEDPMYRGMHRAHQIVRDSY